jgi:uncharacterized protein YciW
MNISDSTILSVSGVTPATDVGKAVATRENVVAMTQAAEDAVLRPRDAGAFGHELRAAIAARVAKLAKEDLLAAHYLNGTGDLAVLADPAETGAGQGLSVILAFVDKVANQTRETSDGDILGLQEAGVSDPDIVRLCELVAFLAYQIRFTAGLRLMQETLV